MFLADISRIKLERELYQATIIYSTVGSTSLSTGNLNKFERNSSSLNAMKAETNFLKKQTTQPSCPLVFPNLVTSQWLQITFSKS